jgi:uncharacterized membrane protein YeiH
MGELLFWLDAAAVLVFAVSGALTASRKQLDIVGFMFVASITGLGGGTLRDVLLAETSVLWVREPYYIVLTCAAAIAVYFTAHVVESRYRLLLWADAMGLALYSVLGAAIAQGVGAADLVAVLMGVMTATFGGLIRDVVCGETPLVLRQEIYATAAAAGSASYVVLLHLQSGDTAAAVGGAAVTFLIRAAALHFDLRVPVYKPRPARDYPPR